MKSKFQTGELATFEDFARLWRTEDDCIQELQYRNQRTNFFYMSPDPEKGKKKAIVLILGAKKCSYHIIYKVLWYETILWVQQQDLVEITHDNNQIK